METCNSGLKCAVLYAKTTDKGWDTETGKSGANHAFLHAQNDRLCLVPIETCMLVQKSLFCVKNHR